LTREAINVISLISEINLGLDIEYSFFTPRSLGIEMNFLPYHFFRLYLYKESEMHLSGFDHRYSLLHIDL